MTTLFFEVAGLELSEDTTASTLTVSLSAAPSVPVSVQYAFIDDSAVSPADYTAPGGGILSFPPMLTAPRTIAITVVNDDLDETAERFTLRLSNPVGIEFAGGATTQDFNLVILDNDAPELTIAAVSSTVNEDTMGAEFTVTASIVPATPLAVRFDVTQTGNFLDGAPGQRTEALTFTQSTTPGDTTATAVYTVALDDDRIDETNGDITVQLAESGITGAYTLSTGNPAVTVTVEDDDDTTVPTVSVVNNNVSVDESAGTLMFTVTIDAAPGENEVITYAVTGADAADYTVGGTGNLNFVMNSTASQLISVTINEDLIDEVDETLTVTISRAPGATPDNLVVSATPLLPPQ